MTRNGKSTTGFAILLLCLYSLWFFGLANLKGLPIGNDEYNTINRIRNIGLDQPHSLSKTLDNLAAISPDHGPLYFVIINLWQRVAGADLFSLRLPSVFFALLSLATAYRIGRLGGDDGVGLRPRFCLPFCLSFSITRT